MMTRTKRLAALVAAFFLTGCGSDLPKTCPVSGKVTVSGADTAQLAGHHVEVVSETDPNVRASGVIRPDGGFKLETLHGSAVLDGVREGTYRVRILRAEEDDDGKRLKKPPVADRYLQFQRSGLTLAVPAAAELTLAVSAR
jgi:hypothetical protein